MGTKWKPLLKCLLSLNGSVLIWSPDFCRAILLIELFKFSFEVFLLGGRVKEACALETRLDLSVVGWCCCRKCSLFGMLLASGPMLPAVWLLAAPSNDTNKLLNSALFLPSRNEFERSREIGCVWLDTLAGVSSWAELDSCSLSCAFK